MPFERSLEIERWIDKVHRLIRTRRFSTPMLAEEVGVSIPTISRCVTAMRIRGFDIHAEKHGGGWRYVVAGKRDSQNASKPKTHSNDFNPERPR